VIDHDGALVGVISEGRFLAPYRVDINPPWKLVAEELLAASKRHAGAAHAKLSWSVRVMAPDPICVDEEATLDEVVHDGCASYCTAPSSAVVPWSVSLAVLSW
jgi:hypothetical protein